jgi:uncharacterized protein (UPF0276 family)
MKTHSTARLTFGLGLRKPHYQDFLAGDGPDAVVPVDFVEVISENFMVAGGRPRDILRRVRARHAVALHGVSLRSARRKGWTRTICARCASSSTRSSPSSFPTTCAGRARPASIRTTSCPALYPRGTGRCLRQYRPRAGHSGAGAGGREPVELPAIFPADWSEWDFIAELAARTGCELLLDLNNVHVSATNHGFSVVDYLAGIPMARVRQIHLAGHSQGRELLIDTHDQPVADPVWALLAHVAPALEDVAVMIERDDAIPPLPELLAELDHARALCHLPARWRPGNGPERISGRLPRLADPIR